MEALILPTVQQMRYVARNRCWKPISYSRSGTFSLLGWEKVGLNLNSQLKQIFPGEDGFRPTFQATNGIEISQ